MPRKKRTAAKGEGRIVAHAPREFVEFPVFAVGKQSGPRDVVVFGKKWTIGGIPDPLMGKKEMVLTNSFDHDHAAVVMCLLQKYHEQNGIDDNYGQAVSTSLGELAIRIYGNDQAYYRQKARSLLRDLRYTNISIELSPKRRRVFSIIDGFVFNDDDDNKLDLILEKVRFNMEFSKHLLNYQNLYKIRYDVYLGMSSPLAKAIYMHIPMRIEKCGEGNPFIICVEKMLNDVGASVPEYKSKREQMFTQGKNSVISQLDGADTLSNGKMSVKIEDGVDDYIILFWVENPSNKDALEAEIVEGNEELDKGAKEKLDKLEMEFRDMLWSGVETAFRRLVLVEWGGIEAVEVYLPQLKKIMSRFNGDNKTAFINKLCGDNSKRYAELKAVQREKANQMEQPLLFEGGWKHSEEEENAYKAFIADSTWKDRLKEKIVKAKELVKIDKDSDINEFQIEMIEERFIRSNNAIPNYDEYKIYVEPVMVIA